jgi:hypothetical protein
MLAHKDKMPGLIENSGNMERMKNLTNDEERNKNLG